MSDVSQLVKDAERGKPAKSQGAESKSGGSITENVNTAASQLVTQSAKDGVETGRKANDAFALSFAQTRKAGTQQMLKSVEQAGQATHAAVAAVDVDAIVREAATGTDPFSMELPSLLG